MPIYVDTATVRALTDTVMDDDRLAILTDVATRQVEACDYEDPVLAQTLAEYLAAHYVMVADPKEISAKLMDGTTIAFPQHRQGRGLGSTPWGEMVIQYDSVGCLTAALSGKVRIINLAPRGGCP